MHDNCNRRRTSKKTSKLHILLSSCYRIGSNYKWNRSQINWNRKSQFSFHLRRAYFQPLNVVRWSLSDHTMFSIYQINASSWDIIQVCRRKHVILLRCQSYPFVFMFALVYTSSTHTRHICVLVLWVTDVILHALYRQKVAILGYQARQNA